VDEFLVGDRGALVATEIQERVDQPVVVQGVLADRRDREQRVEMDGDVIDLGDSTSELAAARRRSPPLAAGRVNSRRSAAVSDEGRAPGGICTFADAPGGTRTRAARLKRPPL
jgi:hypothetical protein